MTVHYVTTPGEVSASLVRQLQLSPAFRLRVGLYALAVVILIFVGWGRRFGYSISVALVAVLVTALLFAMLPLVMRLFVKPQERRLTVTSNGIDTEIGTKSGSIPWKSVSDVVVDGATIYVIGRSGNSFVVPTRAFSSRDERDAFIKLIEDYRKGQEGA